MPEKSKIDEIELRSEEVQDILNRIPHWMIRYGNVVFALLIVLLLVFSWFVKYPDVVSSEVVITTHIPPQKEFARTDGRIHHLLLQDNKQVKEGEFIAVLDNPANFKDVVLLKSIIDTINLGAGEITFPFDDLPILFLGELEPDFAVFQNAYLQYRLNKELGPYVNIGSALEITQEELRARLVVMKNQREIILSELSYKKKDLNRFESLYENGAVAIQELEIKQMEYLQSERNLKSMDVSISQLKENITNIDRDNKANAITQNMEELNLYSKALQAFNQLRKSLREWELRYTFIANISGKVSFINVWSENQYVNSGDLLFTIVPNANSNYIARLKTPAQNFGKVKTGQRVIIRLQNFPDQEFGVLSGSVENISLTPDREGFYIIEVGLAERLITNYNKEIQFTQEMSGIAEIITEDLRLIERFFYQLRGLFNRN